MQTYKVPDLSCGHCVQTITRAVKGVDANATVSVDLQRKEVSVASEADSKRIAAALRDAGYDSEPLAA